jgi:hypothetical protein
MLQPVHLGPVDDKLGRVTVKAELDDAVASNLEPLHPEDVTRPVPNDYLLRAFAIKN